MMTNTTTSLSAPLVLPACMDHAASAGVLQDILNRLADGTRLRIDASQIVELHLSATQIMLAASQAPNVAILNPSHAYTSHFAALAIDCPVSFEDLSEETTIDARPVENAARPTRVLAIDDSKTMRDMLRLTLVSAGFDVVQAVDGMDGLDALTRETVDVIITDINMPKLDGYGVIERLRANPAYDATPILVLTTESDAEKKQRARSLGATGFIVKPFDPETLVEVIHKVFPPKQN